ncbi:MAG: hypothetical protein ACRENE_01010, partial [Polyangiaceae bacterium]
MITRGIRMLRAMRSIGLVLAPEHITWRQPLVDGTERLTELVQVRACFTELSRRELREHARRFGPFSLEFEIETLRQLGALPVIYVPQTLPDDPHFS